MIFIWRRHTNIFQRFNVINKKNKNKFPAKPTITRCNNNIAENKAKERTTTRITKNLAREKIGKLWIWEEKNWKNADLHMNGNSCTWLVQCIAHYFQCLCELFVPHTQLDVLYLFFFILYSFFKLTVFFWVKDIDGFTNVSATIVFF